MRLRWAAFAMLALAACRSTSVEHRTQGLRELYPADTTTRADVRTSLGGGPILSVTRPEAGWESCSDVDVANRADDVAMETGRQVELVERYILPDGLFGLCYCWFFYDEDDRVVDVAWQYCSD
ncbi:MAG: hypothetical protein H6831_15605 [Planctomycetes bacterium]|nr:hypothetical protein [Planctomycetota bacterium]MCB9905824.1 hypothetical protein [Planctomycetota bacterium]